MSFKNLPSDFNPYDMNYSENTSDLKKQKTISMVFNILNIISISLFISIIFLFIDRVNKNKNLKEGWELPLISSLFSLYMLLSLYIIFTYNSIPFLMISVITNSAVILVLQFSNFLTDQTLN